MGGRGGNGVIAASGTSGASGGTITSGGITYQLDPTKPSQRLTLVEVNLSKLNDAWKKDNLYLPKDKSNDIGGRRESFREFLKTGKNVNAPRAYLTRSGSVSIEDGRHRTATLRDMGKRTIVVAVDKRQARKFRERMGD